MKVLDTIMFPGMPVRRAEHWNVHSDEKYISYSSDNLYYDGASNTLYLDEFNNGNRRLTRLGTIHFAMITSKHVLEYAAIVAAFNQDHSEENEDVAKT